MAERNGQKNQSQSERRGFDSQLWYNNLMDKRTRAAIQQRITEWESMHKDDSDVMLFISIRERAEKLGYVPYPVECLGGAMIVRRFGTWDRAVKLAHLSHPRGARRLIYSQLYKDEYLIQQKLHRKEKIKKESLERVRAGGRSVFRRQKP